MPTNKVIKVTTIPTRTGDTVASYNAYSNIDGLLGAMTPAEAAAGKTFALSDGSSHNITVKAVWTTAGESTTNVSNVVVVDLSIVNYYLKASTTDQVNATISGLSAYGDGDYIEFKYRPKNINTNQPLMADDGASVDGIIQESTAGKVWSRRSAIFTSSEVAILNDWNIVRVNYITINQTSIVMNGVTDDSGVVEPYFPTMSNTQILFKRLTDYLDADIEYIDFNGTKIEFTDTSGVYTVGGITVTIVSDNGATIANLFTAI